MNDVYVSTGAFQLRSLEAIFRQAEGMGLRCIELSGGIEHSPEILSTVLEYSGSFRFLVHNYFPPPAEPFLLNLASPKDDVVERSLAMCLQAVDLCSEIDAPFYSVHCGFTFDSEDGSHMGSPAQLDLARITMDEALHHFTRRLKMLCRYGESRGVKIAIENNVIAQFGLIDGENRLALGADARGLAEIFDRVPYDGLGLLLDVGHAKVNRHTIGAGVNELVETFGDRILAVHVSDNDGKEDQNLPLEEESEVANWIGGLTVPRILESYNLPPGVIDAQVRMLQHI
jgi:sugar phosphate isomerase/epimerase